MAQVTIFKEIFSQVRKDLDCELFYSRQTSQRLTLYLPYNRNNIHRVRKR